MDLSCVHNLLDFEPLARKVLPRAMFSYIQNGAEDEATLRRNRSVFDRYGFIPRMLNDVSGRAQGIELFGHKYASPFGISPVGLGAMYSFGGDVALATAAARCNVPYVLSGASLTRLETVAAAAPHAWFQAYLPGSDDEIRRLLDRAGAAGYRTLVLTVDLPVSVSPDRYVRNGFSSPLRPSVDLALQGITRPRWLVGTFLRTLLAHGMPHLENWRADRGSPVLSKNVQKDIKARDSLSWKHVEAARSFWRGNLVVKGILSAQDAGICRGIGVDGIIVSNHGGRQIDGAVSPLHVLRDIVDAVPELVVMMDSGIRRGSDVLKAIALGARCVFAGRPYNYAVAAAGQAGVVHALGLLRDEVHRNMALLGINHPYEMSMALMRDLADSGLRAGTA
ncbi:alpha-hydroxy acid oxidase [Achromobacter aloeverae]|uniref:Alpha-hydroxy-acid oxidizing enzyme n=1 Tax=Achromobacter aloeverae TaxID=1750518 RepID=A0A4V1MSQ6_9BURK|nr:alpha-hydroxy acid oxidase [Achromobacter aloeverae]RXN92870.1 alpha-hydroxy-acid oxidizing enzyme [Achromobacter aloeverae]